MTHPPRFSAHRWLSVAVAIAGLLLAGGCSDEDGGGGEASSDDVDLPSAGVGSFCAEFSDVLVQDDPDFDRLKASAPDDVQAEVDAVVAFSKSAAGAGEAPDEATIEQFERSVAGMTIYAVGVCDDIEQVVADLDLDEGDLKVLQSYSLEDVRNDDTWPTIKEELGQ